MYIDMGVSNGVQVDRAAQGSNVEMGIGNVRYVDRCCQSFNDEVATQSLYVDVPGRRLQTDHGIIRDMDYVIRDSDGLATENGPDFDSVAMLLTDKSRPAGTCHSSHNHLPVCGRSQPDRAVVIGYRNDGLPTNRISGFSLLLSSEQQ
jgi:hypothetical protein